MGNNTLESCQNMSGLAAGEGLMQILARHLDTLCTCTYRDDTLHCAEIYHAVNHLQSHLVIWPSSHYIMPLYVEN